ncbi:MAG TPA: hypothetical protein VFR21_26425 [Bradyrhizobium sp.]|jgi:hypothetical protein|nr:hypothetical protein [Bradyrhizobium sp.]
MTGMVGNEWSFDDFSPMDLIPTPVSLTTSDGNSEEFMPTPLDELVASARSADFGAEMAKSANRSATHPGGCRELSSESWLL